MQNIIIIIIVIIIIIQIYIVPYHNSAQGALQ